MLTTRFSGVVKDQTGGRRVKFLEYEAHVPMAEVKMREIGTAVHAVARRQADRPGPPVGRLEIGESSVMIAVSSPHRRCACDSSGAAACGGWGRDGLGTGARGRGARARKALISTTRFTPEGGRIELAAVPKNGSVEVSVSDTGVGIAPEDQEAVFEEFRQVGAAEKKAEGTGLGLTRCRKFIELHGSRIWVTSQLGVGSTFTFTLPLRDAGPIPG